MWVRFLVSFLCILLVTQADGARTTSRDAAVSCQAALSPSSPTGVANQAVLDAHRRSYTHPLPYGPILDQGDAGHCWIYGAHSLVTGNALGAGRITRRTKLSVNYTLFWYTLERVHGYMKDIAEVHGENVLDDDEAHYVQGRKLEEGGQFFYYITIAKRYGMVPESAMPPTAATDNSEILFRDIKDELAHFAMAVKALRDSHASPTGRLTPPRRARYLAGLPALSNRTIAKIYHILEVHLGTPPTEARAQGSRLTPHEYMADVLGFDPDDYVSVSAYPTGDADARAYRVANLSADGSKEEQAIYLNVSTKRYMELINKALVRGQPVLLGLDRSGPVDDETGIMHHQHIDTAPLYRNSRRLTRDERIITGSQGSGHAMVLVGYDQPDDEHSIVKYKAQNSWGSDSGDWGIYHIYREWLEIYGRDMVIHRSLLSRTERAALKAPVESPAFNRLL